MKTQASKGRAGGRSPASRASAARRPASVRGNASSKPRPEDSRLSRPATPISRAAPVPAPDPAQIRQQQSYEEAIRLFQAEKLDRAAVLFQKAAEGPNKAIAHHAQVHAQICAQRLHPPEVKLKTADDHYNYGVTLMNAGKLPQATTQLEKALALSPRAGYIHYALAASLALQGNAPATYERLKTAIDLDPRNRFLARGDSDFSRVLEYAPLASLLHLERSGAPKAS